MRMFLFYLALIDFSYKLSGKLTFRGFIKLPFRKSLQTIFPFFRGLGKSLEVDVLLNSRVCGLRRMTLVTLSNLFGMNWMVPNLNSGTGKCSLLEYKMASLVEKVKLSDGKEQQ